MILFSTVIFILLFLFFYRKEAYSLPFLLGLHYNIHVSGGEELCVPLAPHVGMLLRNGMEQDRFFTCAPHEGDFFEETCVEQTSDPNVKPRFNIVYEVGPTLVVNKQPGVLTQAPAGVDSLESRVKEFMNLRAGRSGKRYLGLPHRLDRPASGLLVFAKHVRAARRLSDQFQERSVVKKYWALVSGIVLEESGTWYDYMRKIPGRAESELVSPMKPDAREAILHFHVLGRFDNVTWLEIELETGRTHQIRLQCSSRGFPLLGDELYGSTTPFGIQYEDGRERAIALHSREMSFVDFTTKERVTLRAPLYAPWKKWIQVEGEETVEEMFLKPVPFVTNIFGNNEDSSPLPKTDAEE